VAKTIREHLVSTKNLKLGPLECGNLKERNSPWGTDRDLLNLANLWSKKPFLEKLYYPESPLKKTDYEDRATALIIGDSFTWTPLHFFNQQGTFSKRKFYYYYNTEETAWIAKGRTGPIRKLGRRRALKRNKIDWQGDIFKRNVIIIFVNKTAIPQLGHGFMQEALLASK